MAKRTTPKAPAEDTAAPQKPPVQRSRASDATQSLPPDAERQSSSMASEPSEEDIRMRAYHRYLERGGGHGMDFEDWLEAEREVRERK